MTTPPTVLVTRPSPQAEALADSLSGAGLAVITIPAFRFRPLSPDAERLPAAAAAGRRLLIFTSPRAVDFGLNVLADAVVAASELGAIGAATAQRLVDAGREVALVPDDGYTSEAFLEQATLSEKPGEAWLVTAPGGRELLAAGLRQRGWTVRSLHVYERVPAVLSEEAIDEIRRAPRLWTIWTSREAMRQLALRLPRDAWERIRAGYWFVVSERLEQLARQQRVTQVDTLPGPSNEHITAGIVAAMDAEAAAT